MRSEFSTFIRTDDGINRFMRDVNSLFGQATGDLSWRQLFLLYQVYHAPSENRIQCPVSRRLSFTWTCRIMGFVPHVLATWCLITPQLTAYCWFVDTYGTSNYFQRLTFLSSQVNCVRWLSGYVLMHICNTKVINPSEGGCGLPFLFLYCWQLYTISSALLRPFRYAPRTRGRRTCCTSNLTVG